MRLLSFETIDGQEGSYNDLIKQLVRKTRHYYSEVSGDEFKIVIPELKAMQAKIQHLDRDFGNEYRDYMSDIIEELGEESGAEKLLIEELKRTATVLIPQLGGQDFNFDDFSFDFDNRYTFWSGIIGGTFLALSYFGTDQSQVQRYLSGKSVKEMQMGLIFSNQGALIGHI